MEWSWYGKSEGQTLSNLPHICFSSVSNRQLVEKSEGKVKREIGEEQLNVIMNVNMMMNGTISEG